MIKLINVTKYYQTGSEVVKALDGVSLEIKNGEMLAIMGPSGSGKSTLMNMLGCLDVPTSGQYFLDDKEVSKMDEDDLADIRSHKVGFVFQSFNLLARLTAFENVELPLIYMGLGAAERREKAVKALEMVGLADRMDHKPAELSGGQQQRVAIARAFAGDPAIVMADEPTGNLDSKSGKEIMEVLKELHRHGKTIVLITHDRQVACQAGRTINMMDGRIVSEEEVAC